MTVNYEVAVGALSFILSTLWTTRWGPWGKTTGVLGVGRRQAGLDGYDSG